MWLERDKIDVLDSALFKRRRENFHQALTHVFSGPAGPDAKPAACPKCRKDLIRRSLPYVELLVNACPEHHGVWMAPEVVSKLRDFFIESAASPRRPHFGFRLPRGLVLIAGLVVFFQAAGMLAEFSVRMARRAEPYRISANYWPQQPAGTLAAWPAQAEGIDSESLLYLTELGRRLESGTMNRLNLEIVLESGRPSREIVQVYDIYRAKQSAWRARLERLQVPERLRPFHAKFLEAVSAQMAFHKAWVEARAVDRSLRLEHLLGHLSLETSSRALHDAHELLKAAFPDLDAGTHAAIETRLCAFDIL